MRLAPVPMRWAGNPREAVRMAAASSLTTHGAVEAVDGCRYLCGLMVGALRGDSKEALLGPCYEPEQGIWMEEPLTGAIHEVAAGSFVRREPPKICGSGYVVRSLEAALWAFHRSETFEEGCLAAANLGDDADTTAAVYGQLAGAYYGVQGIPRDWVEKLAMRELIEETAVRLLAASAVA
jgi:ADP-ribosylglycohydrolase